MKTGDENVFIMFHAGDAAGIGSVNCLEKQRDKEKKMIKKYVLMAAAAGLLLAPAGAFAKMGSGQMSAKSKDIDVEFFGSLKSYPHFMTDVDFNDDNTTRDFILDENGTMKDHSVRNELRIGWKGMGENWDFLVILEGDFNMNKANGDRGDGGFGPDSSAGMSGNSFGLEKMEFGYDFGPFKLSTGINGRALDMKTGGILYGDDHPFFGIKGKAGSMNWEALYLMVQDDIYSDGGILDGDDIDWRVYSLRASFDLGGFTLAPMYAFSDNNEQEAQTHYLGVEGYGKIGIVTPRFEVIYATGEMDEEISKGITDDYDIDAFGAFASLEFDLGKKFNPYIGGYFLEGDGDAGDDDIEAFNGITNISRYTPTFGIENAMIYRYNTSLGSHLYSNNFNRLGSLSIGGNSGLGGYGGISNSSSADAPGMIMYGLGAKGQLTDEFSYKTQLMFFELEDTGAIEDVYGKKIDDDMGWEWDLQLTYVFNNHFSVGNTLAIFDPGDAIEDLWGDDNDDTAYMDTIELKWKF